MESDIVVSKYRVRHFLAERASANILQLREDEIYDLIRYEGIKGMEQVDGPGLFDALQSIFPEFALVDFSGEDNNNIILTIKKGLPGNMDDIKTDIIRILQMKLMV